MGSNPPSQNERGRYGNPSSSPSPAQVRARLRAETDAKIASMFGNLSARHNPSNAAPQQSGVSPQQTQQSAPQRPATYNPHQAQLPRQTVAQRPVNPAVPVAQPVVNPAVLQTQPVVNPAVSLAGSTLLRGLSSAPSPFGAALVQTVIRPQQAQHIPPPQAQAQAHAQAQAQAQAQAPLVVRQTQTTVAQNPAPPTNYANEP